MCNPNRYNVIPVTQLVEVSLGTIPSASKGGGGANIRLKIPDTLARVSCWYFVVLWTCAHIEQITDLHFIIYVFRGAGRVQACVIEFMLPGGSPVI